MRNSIDAVADRDFALDYLYAAAVLFTHLSRIGEEIVLWATSEFGFVRLPETAATGSSMMPQKLNPDVAELVRGKAGTSIGRLTGLLATVKGLPLAYDRDLQEDKSPVFSTRRDTRLALEALTVLVSGLEVDRARMAKAAGDPLLLATDAAEALVRDGVPFRDAHEQVAESVRDGSFKKPRKGAKRGRPGPGGIRDALAEARHRFVDNLRHGAREAHRDPLARRRRVQHVNNAVYATYLEECRDEWLDRVLGEAGDPWDFVLARVAIDFRRELRLDDAEVVVSCALARIGNSSLTLAEQIRTRDGDLAAEAEAVLVARDRDLGRSRPLSEIERQALERSL